MNVRLPNVEYKYERKDGELCESCLINKRSKTARMCLACLKELQVSKRERYALLPESSYGSEFKGYGMVKWKGPKLPADVITALQFVMRGAESSRHLASLMGISHAEAKEYLRQLRYAYKCSTGMIRDNAGLRGWRVIK